MIEKVIIMGAAGRIPNIEELKEYEPLVDQKIVVYVGVDYEKIQMHLSKRVGAGIVEQQFENLKVPISQITHLLREYRLIITHGNSPQVENFLLKQQVYIRCQ
ncbi:MAG: hypothetical protein U9R24_04345 [Thermodesulfobacteriota bacterium]|nr:hypothetical protein [Thermodesulfobacteriota bacterium]